VSPRVGSTRDCLRRSNLGHGSKGGSHNPGGKGGAAAAAATGSGQGRVGSGAGSIGGVWRESYFTLSVCRPRCSRAGYQHNPCMVWGVGPCLGVVVVKGKDVPGVCVVAWVVGVEGHLLFPVLTFWIVIPLHQFTLLPSNSRPLIEYMGAYECLSSGVQGLQFLLSRGRGSKVIAIWGFEGFGILFLG